MKIQLIHPPLYLNVHALTALRPSLPLGLAYIAAALRREGHEVSLVDAVAGAPEQVTLDGSLHRLGLTPEEVVERLDPEAECYALTNMWSFSWPLVRQICRLLRERFPDTPLVCGGEHFTGLPEHSLREAPIDFVVLGEGEETAVELFGAIERDEPVTDIAGIAYLDGERFVASPRRARNQAVDELPWPAWDLIDVAAYNEHGFVNGLRLGMTVPILATRGCPYSCTYCSSPNMWTTRYVTRDPVDVVDEIEQYNQTYGAVNFPFQDLTAIIKKDWVVRFCNELLERDLKITWQFPSGTRCEVIDDEVAGLLRASGGYALAFAPESGSERTRKLIKKKMKTESLMQAVEASVRNHLNITAFIVIGFPHDTPEDLRQTSRLMRQLALKGIDDVAIGFFFPIPNTELYYQLLESGRVELNDEFLETPIYANEARLLRENNYCDHMGHWKLTLWKYRLLTNFYGLSFLRRPWRVFQVIHNSLRGRETRKLETFLVEFRRKCLVWMRGKENKKATQKSV